MNTFARKNIKQYAGKTVLRLLPILQRVIKPCLYILRNKTKKELKYSRTHGRVLKKTKHHFTYTLQSIEVYGYKRMHKYWTIVSNKIWLVGRIEYFDSVEYRVFQKHKTMKTISNFFLMIYKFFRSLFVTKLPKGSSITPQPYTDPKVSKEKYGARASVKNKAAFNNNRKKNQRKEFSIHIL